MLDLHPIPWISQGSAQWIDRGHCTLLSEIPPGRAKLVAVKEGTRVVEGMDVSQGLAVGVGRRDRTKS